MVASAALFVIINLLHTLLFGYFSAYEPHTHFTCEAPLMKGNYTFCSTQIFYIYVFHFFETLSRSIVSKNPVPFTQRGKGQRVQTGVRAYRCDTHTHILHTRFYVMM